MPRGFLLNISRWFALSLVGFAAGCAATSGSRDEAVPSHLRSQMDVAIAKVRPALVRIRVVSTEYSDGREFKSQSVGSGAIVTKDGYIVTNHHVAGHATRMFCTLWNREEVEAELIGTDPLTDISVIKLKPESPRTFEYVVFGDSAKMRVGDYVLAMGSPMALSQSVTLGILSNIEMIMPRFMGSRGRFRLDGEDVGGLVKWFGHDAAIYGGNSGGPLVNLRGDIIGINEISVGLSGAIPGNLAKGVAEQLMAKGKVERSWIGVEVQTLFKHSKDEKGILISGVVDESPADKAGLQSGDRMIRLNGSAIDAHFDEQLPDFIRLISALPIGKPVPALVERDGKQITLNITAIERPPASPEQEEIKQWGVTVRNLSPLIAREMKRPNLDGVIATSVRPGGPAGEAKPSIESADVLVEVGGQPIKNVKDLVEFTRKLTAGKTEPVSVVATFEREAARYMTVVKVGIQEFKEPGREVSKAWLPVETQVISRDLAKFLDKPALKGFYITRVYPHTSAEKAGLQPGDYITALDGEKLTATAAEHADELSTMIRQYDIGKTVELTILRSNEEKKVSVELARSPRMRREMKKYRNEEFEFTARDVSFFDAAEEQWQETQKGALVEEVKSGSWAELGSLNVGDLIVSVDGKAVDNLDDLKKSMTEITTQKKSVVIMKVIRGIHTNFLELEPDWKN